MSSADTEDAGAPACVNEASVDNTTDSNAVVSVVSLTVAGIARATAAAASPEYAWASVLVSGASVKSELLRQLVQESTCDRQRCIALGEGATVDVADPIPQPIAVRLAIQYMPVNRVDVIVVVPPVKGQRTIAPVPVARSRSRTILLPS